MSLHDRLVAEVERRKALAVAATPGPWTTSGPDTIAEWMIYGEKWAVANAIVSEYHGDAMALRGGPDGDQANRNADYIAAHDPADARRRYEHYERVLERHAPLLHRFEGLLCRGCYNDSKLGECDPWPCDDITDLAGALDVEVTDG
jgi:hypothetical protein